MTPAHELLEQQAEITGLLLFYLQVPFTESTYIRGVLPAPPPAEALRIVVGPQVGQDLDEAIVHEIPLRAGADKDFLSVGDIVGLLRTLLSTTQIVSSDQVDTAMGLRIIRVDPAAVEPAAPTPADETLTVLRSLSLPYPEEEPDPRLCGFLALKHDRLRLYFASEDAPGVIAADIRTSGPTAALLAALPSLITEEERRTHDDADPHCSYVVDLTNW
jgi:hypothetical protein